MQHNIKSIRPFIGSSNFELSRNFYKDWGFEETILGDNFSVFFTEGFSFYLQDAYVKDWIDNTMVFMEVANVARYWDELQNLNLTAKYSTVKLTPVQSFHWGKECFVHDPSGILWHIGEFYH